MTAGAFYRAKMAPVERDDHPGPQSVGQHDYRRIYGSERKVLVLINEGSDSLPIVVVGGPHVVVSKGPEESCFDCGSHSPSDQVSDLSDDKDWDDKTEAGLLKRIQGTKMVLVVAIDGRVQRTRVNDGDAWCQLASAYGRYG